jgi:LacI family transcriptional regulator
MRSWRCARGSVDVGHQRVAARRLVIVVLVTNLPKGLPVVLLNCRTDNPLFDTITTDGFGGTREMISYLLDLGHRRIAIIKGNEINYEARERLRGYRAAFLDRNLSPDPTLELTGDFTEASGFDAARNVIAMAQPPTAIFASNDAMAIGALGAIREASLRIPQDISVCGFDDIPVARYLHPPLTTVHVPIHDLGTMAISRLFDRLEKKTKRASAHMLVSTTLSIRSSCRKITPKNHQEKEGHAA